MKKLSVSAINKIKKDWSFNAFIIGITFFISIAISAFYEVLREIMPAYVILVIFGSISVFLLEFFSYVFDKLEDIQKEKPISMYSLFKKYLRTCLDRLVGFIRSTFVTKRQ